MAMVNANAGRTAAWEGKDERPFEARYADFVKNTEAKFRKAHDKGEAFYQLDPKLVKAPVAGLRNKYGKRYPFTKENSVILMQATMDQGFTDTRWISAQQLQKAGVHVIKGEKGTVVVKRDKDHKPVGLVSYFNAEQIDRKNQEKLGLEPASTASKFRDTVAFETANYLYNNVSYEKPGTLFDQFAKASQTAYEIAAGRDRIFGEKRLEAIDKVSLREQADSPEMRLMQEAKRVRKADPEASNFMYKATVAMLKDGSYTDEQIEKALTKVSPTPTGLDFDKNYAHRTLEAAKKDREIVKAQRLAASR